MPMSRPRPRPLASAEGPEQNLLHFKELRNKMCRLKPSFMMWTKGTLEQNAPEPAQEFTCGHTFNKTSRPLPGQTLKDSNTVRRPVVNLSLTKEFQPLTTQSGAGHVARATWAVNTLISHTVLHCNLLNFPPLWGCNAERPEKESRTYWSVSQACQPKAQG